MTMKYTDCKHGRAEYGSYTQISKDYWDSLQQEPLDGLALKDQYFANLVHLTNPEDIQISLSGDVSIGAVEIKDADTDTRVNVTEYTNANAVNAVIVDTNGDAIVNFGGLLEVQGPSISLNGALGSSGDVDGLAVDVSDYTNYTIHIMSSGVTDGADIYVESSFSGTGDWAKVGHIKIDSDSEDTNELAFAGPRAYIYLRVVIENGVDGTYDADIYATR